MPLDFTSSWTDGENPTAAKFNTAWRNNATALKGAPPDYTASTISAVAADNSFNDSAAGFPAWALTAGDIITSSGFTDPDNNLSLIDGALIVSATTSKIVVSGATLVDEAAGAAIAFVFKQASTPRSAEQRAPEFRHNTADLLLPEPEIRHTYSGAGGGTSHRYLINTLAAAFGSQAGRLVGSISDTDEGIRELLAQIEWTRTGAAEGSIGFNAYRYDEGLEQQVTSGVTPLLVDEDGLVKINGGTGNGHELEVDGDVRAAQFRQAGSPIGAWTLDTAPAQPTMKFTGDADAATWQAHDLEVTSETECTLNVPRLRGVGWQTQTAAGASATGITVQGRSGFPTYTFEYETALTTISASVTDNSFSDSQDLFPVGFIFPGDTVTFSGFEAEQNNRTFEIVSITASKVVVTGSRVVEETAGASVTVVFTAGYTTVCQTPALARSGYYEIKALITVPFSSPGTLTSAFALNALMVGKIPGAPLSEIFGDGCTKFYCAGEAVGETKQLHMVSRWNAAAGDVLRCQLANTSEAAVTVQGSIMARWLSTGEDVEIPLMAVTYTLGTLTVT